MNSLNLQNMIEACHEGNLERVKKYHDEKVPLDIITSKSGLSLLHYAAAGGHSELARWLIEKKAPVDLKDKMGRTPLHLACEIGKIEIIAALLKGGADKNTSDISGLTPLHLACSSHERKQDPYFRGKLALRLFAEGANPRLKDNEGYSPVAYLDYAQLQKFENVTYPFSLNRDSWVKILEFLPKDQLINKIPFVCKAFHNLSTFTLVTNFYKP